MHVLIVDDSAVMRQTVSAILTADPATTVSVAADPIIAMQKMAAQRPDVILLDIEMPRMDGLTFLQKIMAEDPIPVVVCSAVTGPRSDAAFKALEHGAIDVVAKPKVGLRDFLQESSVLLTDALRAASQARLGTISRKTADPVRSTPHLARSSADDGKIVAIGASTGGTEALRSILMRIPKDGPAMVIVQHMPEGFTAAFARRLNADVALEVREAIDGDRIKPGLALIAPGNRHMRVLSDGSGVVVSLSDGPLISRHRPSVDVLFHSVADAVSSRGVGVILTGMGADGAEGLLRMRRAGAATIAQDERSSVVFGMPREAILRGAASEVLPLTEIPGAILRTSVHQRLAVP
jgi:two-component system, chemotaxis family, protein-glutamate methylesterase/glutaminase